MKKLSVFVLLFFIVIITGCTSDKSKIKLLNSRQMIRYVNKNYGKAIIQNESRTKDSVNYTLKDSEYSFIYDCVNYKKEICVGASCSGYYTSEINCDFEEKYNEYIVQTLNMSNIVEIYSHPNLDKILLSLHYLNENDAKKDIKKVTKAIKGIDKRKYFIDIMLIYMILMSKKLGKNLVLMILKTVNMLVHMIRT